MQIAHTEGFALSPLNIFSPKPVLMAGFFISEFVDLFVVGMIDYLIYFYLGNDKFDEISFPATLV